MHSNLCQLMRGTWNTRECEGFHFCMDYFTRHCTTRNWFRFLFLFLLQSLADWSSFRIGHYYAIYNSRSVGVYDNPGRAPLREYIFIVQATLACNRLLSSYDQQVAMIRRFDGDRIGTISASVPSSSVLPQSSGRGTLGFRRRVNLESRIFLSSFSFIGILISFASYCCGLLFIRIPVLSRASVVVST